MRRYVFLLALKSPKCTRDQRARIVNALRQGLL